MIVAVAVCPGAPLLVSGLAPTLAAVVPDLVNSCVAAVATLRGVDRILLLTSGPRMRDRRIGKPEVSLRHPPGTEVNSSVFTDSRLPSCFSSQLAGVAEPKSGRTAPAAGVGVVVGVALLDAAGIISPATAIELGHTGTAGGHGDVALLSEAAGGPADRVGLLVIGEGTASRGSDSPGGGHDGARAFDEILVAAVAAADPAALSAAVTAGHAWATGMIWTSGPALGALAWLCADLPPATAEILYEGSPFGVEYLVATWTWADPAQTLTVSSERT